MVMPKLLLVVLIYRVSEDLFKIMTIRNGNDSAAFDLR
jgi:hypothetical protein